MYDSEDNLVIIGKGQQDVKKNPESHTGHAKCQGFVLVDKIFASETRIIFMFTYPIPKSPRILLETINDSGIQ